MTLRSSKIHEHEPQDQRPANSRIAKRTPRTADRDLAALPPETARLALKFLVPEPLLNDLERLDRALDLDVLSGGDVERVRVIRALLANLEAAEEQA